MNGAQRPAMKSNQDRMLEMLGITAPKRENWCKHTGWWVRLLHADKPCPDCGLMLPPWLR